MLLMKEEDADKLGFKTGHKKNCLQQSRGCGVAWETRVEGDLAKRKRRAAKKFSRKYAV